MSRPMGLRAIPVRVNSPKSAKRSRVITTQSAGNLGFKSGKHTHGLRRHGPGIVTKLAGLSCRWSPLAVVIELQANGLCRPSSSMHSVGTDIRQGRGLDGS